MSDTDKKTSSKMHPTLVSIRLVVFTLSILHDNSDEQSSGLQCTFCSVIDGNMSFGDMLSRNHLGPRRVRHVVNYGEPKSNTTPRMGGSSYV